MNGNRRQRLVRRLTLERAEANARRLGMDRREFLASAMGMCTTLFVINEVTACSSKVVTSSRDGVSGGGTDGGLMGAGGRGGGLTGAGGSGGERTLVADGAVPDAGGHCVPPEAMFDQSCANAVVGGTEFIFDVETHWFSTEDLANFPAYTQAFGALFAIATEDNYVNTFFCNSDTAMTCLVPWPGVECSSAQRVGCGLPLTNEHIVASRDKINALSGNTQRVLNHALVMPQDPSGIDGQLAVMEEFACLHGVSAWQLYPGFKPGFRFDDPGGLGEQVLQKGLELGVNRFSIHKGLPIGNFYDTTANYPDDIGPMAVKYPDARFIINHASIYAGTTSGGSSEGPYDATSPMPTGTDALIRTVLDNGIPPGKNVYASIGVAFSMLMTDPTQSAHFFGKLLKYLGTDNVLWATSALASSTAPQAQIEAFRAFTIPQSMQDQYGYLALTPDIKAKIFGLNAARLYGVDPNAVRCKVNTCP